MNVKNSLIGLCIAGVSATTFAGFASFEDRATISAALDTNSYSSLTAEMQEKISEDKFSQMVERKTQKEAVKATIDNNDYTSFQEVANEKFLSKVDSQEAFDELVVKSAEKAETKAAVEATIVANDFDAFTTIMAEKRAEKEARMLEAGKTPRESNNDSDRETKIQEKFDSAVTYYEENGELPILGHGKKRWKGFGKNRGNSKRVSQWAVK